MKASVDNTWQITPLRHMLVARAFVLDRTKRSTWARGTQNHAAGAETVNEDGGRDHDVPVVTAEKVVVARQKARALLSRLGSSIQPF